MKNFFYQEAECTRLYNSLGECWHLWTPENFPIIITEDQEFKDIMSIFGHSASCFNDLHIYTFELMNNHLHVCLSGYKDTVDQWFHYFKRLLTRYLKKKKRELDSIAFRHQTRLIKSLGEMRNIIIYNNRNGFVVSPQETPYSYPWGANSYFYNTQAKKRYYESAQKYTTRDATLIIHSRQGYYKSELMKVDGYVSPMSFCHIETAEKLFRDASQYFYLLTKKLELQKEIAEQIGESIYYNDNELYQIANTLTNNLFKIALQELNGQQKIEIAKKLRFEYNANGKQIQRILKLDRSIITSLGLN